MSGFSAAAMFRRCAAGTASQGLNGDMASVWLDAAARAAGLPCAACGVIATDFSCGVVKLPPSAITTNVASPLISAWVTAGDGETATQAALPQLQGP